MFAGYLPSSGGLAALEAKLRAGAQQQGTLDTARASSSAGVSASAAQNGAQPGSHVNGAAQQRWQRCSEGKVVTPRFIHARLRCIQCQHWDCRSHRMLVCSVSAGNGLQHASVMYLLLGARSNKRVVSSQTDTWQRVPRAECQFPLQGHRETPVVNSRSVQVQVAEFYKSWDRYGALSNFSAHPIRLPDGPVSASGALPDGPLRQWPSVEHFYQAQKFAGAFPAPSALGQCISINTGGLACLRLAAFALPLQASTYIVGKQTV